MSLRFRINEQITREKSHIRELYNRIAHHAEIAGSSRVMEVQRDAAERAISNIYAEIHEHRKTIKALELPPLSGSLL